MENIKVKKAPKRLKAWIAKQVQGCQLVKGKARFAVQGKDAPYWQADNFVVWAPCPDFVAFGIIYQLED